MKKRANWAIWIVLLGAMLLVRPNALFAQVKAQVVNKASIDLNNLQIQKYEKDLDELRQEKRRLAGEQRKLKSQLDDLSSDIRKLKSRNDRSIFEEMKLQRLLPEHLKLSKEIQKVENSIRQNQALRADLKNRLRNAYEARMDELVRRMSVTSDRKRQIEMMHSYFVFQDKLSSIYDNNPADTRLGAFSVDLDPLDGPREIKEKINLLRDRIRQLKRTLTLIDEEIQRLKNQKSLSDEMQQLIEERNLFEDGVKFSPSPRSLPVRRPGESGSGETGADDTGYDQAGVHTSPLTGQSSRGGSFSGDAVVLEISRLQEEKAKINRIISGLESKIEKFKDRAKRLQLRSTPAPASGKPSTLKEP